MNPSARATRDEETLLGEPAPLTSWVDITHMTTDRLLDLVGVPGGPLADASLFHLEVIEAGPLTPTFRRVLLSPPPASPTSAIGRGRT